MRTRIELWKKYRQEINSSIELQKAVSLTNKKLVLLNKRLLEVFPNYHQKYKFNLQTIEPNFTNEATTKKYFSISKINNLLQKINDAHLVSNSYQAINKIDFSAHTLDDILLEIKNHHQNLQKVNYETFQTNDKNIVNKNIKQKIQVAIDGPSGSGKSTIARAIARKYNLKYVNTGLFYRAIALNATLNKIDLNEEKAVFATLIKNMIELRNNGQIFLKGQNVTNQLRTDQISQAASKISVHPQIRKWAALIQKQYANSSKVIMDGRDTTFNIMPNANIKIFLETSIEERARRRCKENQAKGFESDFKIILQEIKERDYRDRNRDVDPLHQTSDAHIINATNLSIEAVIAQVSLLIERQLRDE